MDKYVKLAAIERLAKTMEDLHKTEKETPETDSEHEGCKCPCCDAPCEACSEAEYEDESEDDSEED